jgi:hypothetical protein
VGCTSCNLKGGCDERKGDQRAVFAATLERLYPGRTWGAPDDEARFRAGVSRGEARRLGRALAELLRAPTFFHEGGEDDLCHFVYVLCVGREPPLVEVRAGRARLDGTEAEGVRERYLRVALSTVARMAAVQEVEMTLAHDDGPALIRESPRAGVYEESLLKRLRQLTAYLAASDVLYCDFGLLDKPVAEAVPGEHAHPGDYVARYGAEPRLCNFLFYAQPPTTATITLVPVLS